MHTLLTRIAMYRNHGHLELLEDLCSTVKETSLLRTGTDGAQPRAEHIQVFHNEYIGAHCHKRVRPEFARWKRSNLKTRWWHSPAVDVKTLIIDGQEVSAREARRF